MGIFIPAPGDDDGFLLPQDARATTCSARSGAPRGGFNSAVESVATLPLPLPPLYRSPLNAWWEKPKRFPSQQQINKKTANRCAVSVFSFHFVLFSCFLLGLFVVELLLVVLIRGVVVVVAFIS